ncbi:MAG TPA: IS1595 family transposase [Bryobacteraceae bacterium]|nr:IS1595 family transposase [Bryobacteraceae bacterium]
MNLIDVSKKFATPEACNDFLEAVRWPDGVECIECCSKRVTKYVKQAGSRKRTNRKTGAEEIKPVPARILYVCLDCNKQFSVTEGTIFNDTHLPLDKWFMAVALMVNAKKGVSAKQLQRDLGTAYKTAWYLGHRIRKAMGLIEAADETPLTGTVEADETYMGAKKYDKRRKRAKYGKEPVFGIVERDGRAKTFHIPHVNRYHVVDKLAGNISIDADLLCTDDSRLYNRVPANIQKHEIVNHSAKEWVRGDVHTATIDGYWGLLKRGVIGSFHQISVKHLHRYLSEFQFRWNNRKSQDIFALVMCALVIGAAMPYAQLIKALEGEQGSGPEVWPDEEPF